MFSGQATLCAKYNYKQFISCADASLHENFIERDIIKLNK